MPLKVLSCCTYRTSRNTEWKQRDWAALKFIKAIKHKQVNKYAYVPVPQEGRKYLSASTAHQAPTWFGKIAARRIRWDSMPRPLALVPMPNSSCCVGQDDPPRTLALTSALQEALDDVRISVIDALRWDERMEPAHEGGSRDPQELYPHFVLVDEIPDGHSVVLIDDVLTRGGHLRAAAAFLDDQGSPVVGAICAGRSDDEFLGDDAFTVRVDVLESFEFETQ